MPSVTNPKSSVLGVGLAPVTSMVHEPSPARAACLPILFRFAAYTVILLATLAGLLQLIMVDDGIEQAVFREGGLVEQIQLGVLITVVALLGFTGWRWRHTAVVLWPLAAVAGMAGIRELDSVFDAWLPGIGWTPLAGILLVVAGAIIYRQRQYFWSRLIGWLHTPAFGLLWAGAVVVVIFAQLIGQGDLWQSVMGAAYQRAFKRTVEESSELFGYVLLLVGTIEAMWHAPALHHAVACGDDQAGDDRI